MIATQYVLELLAVATCALGSWTGAGKSDQTNALKRVPRNRSAIFNSANGIHRRRILFCSAVSQSSRKKCCAATVELGIVALQSKENPTKITEMKGRWRVIFGFRTSWLRGTQSTEPRRSMHQDPVCGFEYGSKFCHFWVGPAQPEKSCSEMHRQNEQTT